MTKRNHQKTPKNTRSIKHRLRKSKRRTPLVKLDKFVNKKTFIRVSYLRCNIVIIHVGRYSALSNSTTSNKLQSPKNRIQAKRNEQGGLWLHVSPSVRQSIISRPEANFTQPSIFSYCLSIFESTDRNAKKNWTLAGKGRPLPATE